MHIGLQSPTYALSFFPQVRFCLIACTHIQRACDRSIKTGPHGNLCKSCRTRQPTDPALPQRIRTLADRIQCRGSEFNGFLARWVIFYEPCPSPRPNLLYKYRVPHVVGYKQASVGKRRCLILPRARGWTRSRNSRCASSKTCYRVFESTAKREVQNV